MTGPVAEYGIVTANDVMVPMRDGVRLATDIYRPARDGEPISGRHPTILGRTSYDKKWDSMWVEPVANFFAPRGYVVAIQDLRGRHRSEGTGQYFHTANPNEGEDGYDTIEWLAAQSWSNGRVGMVGSSHGGIVQTAAALARPQHLTAIWVDVAPTNIFAHEAREGGAMTLQLFGALFLHAHDAQEIRDDPEARREVMEGWRDLRQLIRSMPFKPGQPRSVRSRTWRRSCSTTTTAATMTTSGHWRSATRNGILRSRPTSRACSRAAGTTPLRSPPPGSTRR